MGLLTSPVEKELLPSREGGRNVLKCPQGGLSCLYTSEKTIVVKCTEGVTSQIFVTLNPEWTELWTSNWRWRDLKLRCPGRGEVKYL